LSVCPPTGTGVKVQADDLFETPLDQAEIDFENEGGETYICGNPPYKGQSEMSDKEEKRLVGSLRQHRNSMEVFGLRTGLVLEGETDVPVSQHAMCFCLD